MPQYDLLHGGTSSQDTFSPDTFGNEDITEVKTEALQDEQHQVQQLIPQIDEIIEICDLEIAAVSDIRAYITALGAKAKPEDVMAEYRARELYIQFLNNLKSGTLNRVASMKADQ